MPETYKSVGTIVGVTAATTVYNGVVGTALVNSINISNTDVNNTNYVTLELIKGATAYSLITGEPTSIKNKFSSTRCTIST